MSTNKKRSNASSEAGRSKNEKEDCGELNDDGNELVFEDPFADEFEEEELEDDGDEDDEDEGSARKPSGSSNLEDDEEVNTESKAPKQVWRPGIDKLAEGEELEYDPSAYVMYHSLRTEWPCLSFDFLKDNLGDNRQRVIVLLRIYNIILQMIQ